MTVSGTKLVPLVEEYFQLEEYPEGEPLEETRSLKEIVTYLEKRCIEQELGGISTSTGGTNKKKRNINDKVRRILKKMDNISPTTGKTTKKKYYNNEREEFGQSPTLLHNRFYRQIFTKNEIIAGGNLETILNIASSFESVLPLSNFLWGPTDRSGANNLDDLLYAVTDGYGTFRNEYLDPAPFKLNIEDNSLKNDSTKWFTHNSAWMEDRYFGFKGPVGLEDVLDNIRMNIEENDISKISGILKIDEELKWLKRQYSSRHNRMPNRIIITLALLNLNRSLLGPIPVR
jgi:hypothetical protein